MTGVVEFLRGAWAVAFRNVVVWRQYAAPSALGNFGEPVLYLVALGFGLGSVVPEIGGMRYAEFLAPGLIVSTVMYTATFEGCFGSYTRLSVQGTFEAMLATPVTIGELVAGEVLWGGIKSTFGATAVLTVITLFGLAPSWLALLTLPLAFIAGLMFTAMALAVTSLSGSYESFNYYFTLVVAPMFLFSGVFFPLDQAPGWAAKLAVILPLTHVVTISRALVRGTPGPQLALHAAVIAVVLVVAYALCARLMTRRLQI
jgi:lipooligosaccharide transport system permease protein